MTISEYRQYLIDECEDGNADYVAGLLEDARAKIKAGKGQVSTMTSAGANGKSFGRTVEFSCVEVAAACRAALKSVEGCGNSQITVPNFGG